MEAIAAAGTSLPPRKRLKQNSQWFQDGDEQKQNESQKQLSPPPQISQKRHHDAGDGGSELGLGITDSAEDCIFPASADTQPCSSVHRNGQDFDVLSEGLGIEEIVARAQTWVCKARQDLASAKAEAFSKAAEAVRRSAIAKAALNLAAQAAQEEKQAQIQAHIMIKKKVSRESFCNSHDPSAKPLFKTVTNKMQAKQRVCHPNGSYAKSVIVSSSADAKKKTFCNANSKPVTVSSTAETRKDRFCNSNGLSTKRPNSSSPADSSLLHDEELALELHRAMNSSPRISRNSGLLSHGKSRLGFGFLSKELKKHKKRRLESVRERDDGNSEFSPSAADERTVDGGSVSCHNVTGVEVKESGEEGFEKGVHHLDHSEAESSAGLLALNQDASTQMVGGCQLRDTGRGCDDHDKLAFEASLGLKELRLCNSGKNLGFEPGASGLEKLAETVAVVIEKEHHKHEEGKSQTTFQEVNKARFCSKPISNFGVRYCTDVTDQLQSRSQGSVMNLDSLDNDNAEIRVSHDSGCLDKSCSYKIEGPNIKLHSKISSTPNDLLERSSKSVSEVFPQSMQGSADPLSLWNQGILNASHCYCNDVQLLNFRPPSSVPLRSSNCAAGSQNCS